LSLWDSFQPAEIRFCEEATGSWVGQPVNAFSNAAYVLVGIWLLIKYIRGKKNRKNPMIMLPVSAILIGITSFFYHASSSFLFEVLDLSSMFLLSSFMVSFALYRWRQTKFSVFIKAYTVFFIVPVMLVLLIKGESGLYFFGIEIGIAIVTEWIIWKRRPGIRTGSFIYAGILFLISYGFWLLDFHRILCDPDLHYFQSHALWHVINSFCFILLYRYYNQFSREG
jgi:hypothetical protein